jgi:glycosyltransferase involved in cell wall biosynthesis
MRRSVILPVYKLRNRIEVTLRALERQTLDASQFELIFVDDGPDDETAGTIEAWHTRLERQVLRNPANARRSVSRNRAVHAAGGDALVFLDGDMIPNPQLLARYRDRLEAGDCDVVSGHRRSIDLTVRPALTNARGLLADMSLEQLFDDAAADYARLRAHSVAGQHLTLLGAA